MVEGKREGQGVKVHCSWLCRKGLVSLQNKYQNIFTDFLHPSGSSELLHTDGPHDGFVATWDGMTPGHSQLVSITVSELNTSYTSQEDLQRLKTETTDKDTLFEPNYVYFKTPEHCFVLYKAIYKQPVSIFSHKLHNCTLDLLGTR